MFVVVVINARNSLGPAALGIELPCTEDQAVMLYDMLGTENDG